MILSALAGGLGDEASPSPTPSAPPHSGPLTHSASWECLSTLPTNGSPLRHVTHVRPRPPRRHRVAYFPPESVSSWVLVEMFSYREVRCMRRMSTVWGGINERRWNQPCSFFSQTLVLFSWPIQWTFSLYLIPRKISFSKQEATACDSNINQAQISSDRLQGDLQHCTLFVSRLFQKLPS